MKRIFTYPTPPNARWIKAAYGIAALVLLIACGTGISYQLSHHPELAATFPRDMGFTERQFLFLGAIGLLMAITLFVDCVLENRAQDRQP